MKRAFLPVVLLGSLLGLVSCGGSGDTYSPSPAGGNNAPNPDWTFELGSQAANSVHKSDLINLGTITDLGSISPGGYPHTVPIVAKSLNGYSGTITLGDYPGNAADHLAATPSVQTIVPTTGGANFSVSVTIPASYSYAGSGATFQGVDPQGRTKIAKIAFKVITIKASCAPVTFSNADLADDATLSMTGLNGFNAPVAITFDTDLTGAPAGFSPLPNTVQVTAPNSPVTVSGSAAVTTPVHFTWSAWSAGSYEVIAVLTSGTLVQRIPVQVTVTQPAPQISTVATWQYDNTRQGATGFEKTLNPSNVNAQKFGQLFTQALDGTTEGQPLYMPNVMVNGTAHNVVYVATLNNSVYAFDADSKSGLNANPLWHVNFGAPATLGTEDAGNESPDGILSTPVISYNLGATTTGTIYVCAKVVTGGNFTYSLHGLDITTGAETAGGPVNVTATVQGASGPVTLKPKNAYQRPALLLLNGNVYVAIGGQYGDPQPDRGWVFSYNAANLQSLNSVLTTASDLADNSDSAAGIGGSIWMSAGGPSSDGNSIFVATGNGDFTANAQGHNYGDCILRLTPNLSVADYFTPSNTIVLRNSDLDLGSGCPVLIPSQQGSGPLIVQVSKTNTIYIAKTSNLGQFHATDQLQQEISIGLDHPYLCSPAYFNNRLYLSRTATVQSFAFSGGQISGAPAATSPTTFSGYLPTPTISYDQTNATPASTAVVWVMEQSGSTGILHAYDGTTLAQLYSSSAGGFSKFGVPSVASGKVYVPAGSQLSVYGPVAPPTIRRRKV